MSQVTVEEPSKFRVSQEIHDFFQRDQLQAHYVQFSMKHATPDCLTYSAEAEIDHLSPLQASTPKVSQLCFVTQLEICV